MKRWLSCILITITLMLGVASAQKPNYTQQIIYSKDESGWTTREWLVYGLGPVNNGWELWYQSKTDTVRNNCCDTSYLAAVGYWTPEYFISLSTNNMVLVGCYPSVNNYALTPWFHFPSTACNNAEQVFYEISNGWGLSDPNKSDSVTAYTAWGMGH